MLLSSLEVRNFRSLEHVKLDKLSRFNVFIGRNNAGKSTILSALQFLAANAFRVGGVNYFPDDVSILTAHELGRELSFRLGFETSSADRQRFIKLMVAEGYSSERLEQVLNSPFLRHVYYEFEAPAGRPREIYLTKVHIRTEDNKWARIMDRSGNWGSSTSGHVASAVFNPKNIIELGELTLDVLEGRVTSWGEVALNIDLTDSQVPAHIREIDLWLIPQLSQYFVAGYFFSPFRHSAERMLAAPRKRLAPDGSDLPVVLNYLSGGSRNRFDRIERFLREAVPGVGTLHPGLVDREESGGSGQQDVEITFERADGWNVKLREMGGGVEQLLMVATVLATVDEGATLFLEEPELHLHAGAQRYLIEQLRAESRQVFITTHSSVFINLKPPQSLYVCDWTMLGPPSMELPTKEGLQS